jgi:anti-sigma regulatory factor (Ser/Thr protein kinase)
VADDREVSWDLPDDPEFAGKVRRMIAETLTSWAMPHLSEDTSLIVSELYANALLHGRPPISLSLRAEGHTLRGEITDHGRMRTPTDHTGIYDEHGRGLTIVDALADNWGVAPTRNRPGTTIWFRLAYTDLAKVHRAGP